MFKTASVLSYVLILQIIGAGQEIGCVPSTKDLNSSLLQYNLQIAADPKRAELYVKRGTLLRYLRRNSDAMSDANRAIELTPKSGEGYILLGYLYDDRASYGLAILNYTKAINLEPNDPDTYYARARARALRGESAAAIMDFDKVITLDPNFIAAYSGRGKEHKKRGSVEKADHDLKFGLELINRTLEAASDVRCLADEYLRRSMFYTALGRMELGIADVATAIRLDPSYYWLYFRRGELSFHLGQYESAVADFTRSIEMYPEYANNYKARAMAYDALNKPELAAFDRAKYESISTGKSPVKPFPRPNTK